MIDLTPNQELLLKKAKGELECSQGNQPDSGESWSIFEVPQNYKDAHPRHYTPEILLIGYFHLSSSEGDTCKPDYRRHVYQLLTRNKVTIEDLYKNILPLTKRARGCYSKRDGPDQVENDLFTLSLVLDGCFVLELFSRFTTPGASSSSYSGPNNDIESKPWMLPVLIRDMLMVSNQIPFFILVELFKLTNNKNESSTIDDNIHHRRKLSDLCFDFFSCVAGLHRPVRVVEMMRDYEPKHILDLLRMSFIKPLQKTEHTGKEKKSRWRIGNSTTHTHQNIIPTASDNRAGRHNGAGHGVRRNTWSPRLRCPNLKEKKKSIVRTVLPVIPCVSELQHAGMKLRTPPRRIKQEVDTILEVTHRRGIIYMPSLILDDIMACFLANCTLYEICKEDCSTHFISYTTLLDWLVNTSRDVEYMCRANIIKNYRGSEAEVAKYLNKLGKNVAIHYDDYYLADFFEQVKTYYENVWNVQIASLKDRYFRTPWSFISAVAALILLVLTFLQTLYSAFSYYKQ